MPSLMSETQGGAVAASNSVLISLAVLKVNWDQQRKDYIENFVPFVLECIRTADADVVSMVNLQTQLAREFRLSIPQSVLSVILRRAARRGFLRVDNHTYRRIPEQLSDFPFDKTRNLVLGMEI
jgi:hypothetical protein